MAPAHHYAFGDLSGKTGALSHIRRWASHELTSHGDADQKSVRLKCEIAVVESVLNLSLASFPTCGAKILEVSRKPASCPGGEVPRTLRPILIRMTAVFSSD
jgi:hypothetical protein